MRQFIVILPLVVIGIVTSKAAGQATECVRPNCDGDDCTVACVHGTCNEEGLCECDECWESDSCDSYVNEPPFFEHSERKVYRKISDSTPANERIATLTARDPDGRCPDCACGTVKYAIVREETDPAFQINEDTGEVTTTEGFLPPGSHHRIIVATYNPDPENAKVDVNRLEMNAYAMLKVEVKEMYEGNDYPALNAFDAKDGVPSGDFAAPDGYSYDEPLERAKREIPTGPVDVDNVTFYLEKWGHYENVTTMYIGSKIKFNLAIHIPTTGSDLLVELFTPDTTDTHMCICNVQTTKGTNIGTSVPFPEPVYEAKTADSHEYDRVILDYGNVTCDPVPADADECRIYVTWETVMVENANTVNDTLYWLSSGAEYSDDNEVWVGQASVTAVTMAGEGKTDWSAHGTPTFELTGPADGLVEIGATSVFRVNMTIPYPTSTIAFDAFTPLNGSGVMSVCSVLLVDVGEAYSCLPKEKFGYELFPDPNGKGNNRGRAEFGRITNANSREPVQDLSTQTLVVEFAMYVYDDEANIGNQYWVGAAIEIGTDQIWAGQIYVEVVNRTAKNTLVNKEHLAPAGKHEHVVEEKIGEVLEELLGKGEGGKGEEEGGWVNTGKGERWMHGVFDGNEWKPDHVVVNKQKEKMVKKEGEEEMNEVDGDGSKGIWKIGNWFNAKASGYGVQKDGGVRADGYKWVQQKPGNANDGGLFFADGFDFGSGSVVQVSVLLLILSIAMMMMMMF